MQSLAFAVSVTAIAMTSASGCSGSSTGTSSGSASDGGPLGTAGSGTTLSCVLQLSGFGPQCQFYEATGADAARTISSLRSGCVDQAGAKAQVVDSCPAADTLGGCKKPITVQGASDVKLYETNFEYKPAADAGVLAHKTAADVEGFCKSQGAATTYVASP